MIGRPPRSKRTDTLLPDTTRFRSLQLQAPLAFAVDSLELEAAPEDGGYRYRLGAREDGARFAIAAAGADPLAVTAGALAVTLDGSFDSQAGHAADLTARPGGLELPDYTFDAQAAAIATGRESGMERECQNTSIEGGAL